MCTICFLFPKNPISSAAAVAVAWVTPDAGELCSKAIRRHQIWAGPMTMHERGSCWVLGILSSEGKVKSYPHPPMISSHFLCAFLWTTKKHVLRDSVPEGRLGNVCAIQPLCTNQPGDRTKYKLKQQSFVFSLSTCQSQLLHADKICSSKPSSVNIASLTLK